MGCEAALRTTVLRSLFFVVVIVSGFEWVCGRGGGEWLVGVVKGGLGGGRSFLLWESHIHTDGR